VDGRYPSGYEIKNQVPVALLQMTKPDYPKFVSEGGPLGKIAVVGDISFRVIGVLTGKEMAVVVPYTFYPTLVNPDVQIQFLAQFPETKAFGRLNDDAITWMKQFGLNGDFFDTDGGSKNILTMLGYLPKFTLLMSVVVGISLVVGGMGIMNTVLSSVVRRTKEIGIRKSIGAPKSSIIMQFLLETVLISTCGGIVGIAIGMGASMIILNIFKVPVFLPIASMLMCISITILIGIASGLFPAIKAANLDPVEAMGNT